MSTHVRRLEPRGGSDLRRLDIEEWIEQDLTQAARSGQLRAAVAVDGPLARLVEHMLAEETGRTPVLVGSPGAGKTTVVTELVRQVTRGHLPVCLHDAHVVRLSLRSVAGRMPSTARSAAIFERLLDRIDQAHPRRILFIEDLHRAPDHDWIDPILRFIDRTRLPVFLEARRAGFDRLIAAHDGADAALHPIEVPPPGREALRTILAAWAADHQGPAVDMDAIHLAADLASRYLVNDGAARRALSLLRLAVELQPDTRTEPIGTDDIVDCFTRVTHLPRALVDPRVPLDLDRFAAGLKAWLPGQDAAVHTIVETVALLKAGLRRPDRPAGSFLFHGPPGSGRGRCARLLAEEVFGGEGRLTRIDLARHQDDASARELLGDPRASTRKGRQGRLGDLIARQPCGVLHLTHAEAAPPAVLDALAAALEAGAWQDGNGESWSLSGLIVIVSLDSHTATTASRFGPATARVVEIGDPAASTASRGLSPHLLRNIERVVTFREQRGMSAHALLRRTVDDLVVRMGTRVPHLAVELGDEVLDWLARRRGERSRFAEADAQELVEAHIASAVAVYLASNAPEPAMPVRLCVRDGRIRAQPPRLRPHQPGPPPADDDHVARVRLWWADEATVEPAESAWLLLESCGRSDGTRWLMDLLAMYRRWLGRHRVDLTVVGERVEQGRLLSVAVEAVGPEVFDLLRDERGEHHHVSGEGVPAGATVTVLARAVHPPTRHRVAIVPVDDAEGFLLNRPGHRLHLDIPQRAVPLILRGCRADLLQALAEDLVAGLATDEGLGDLVRVYDEQAGLAIDPRDNRVTSDLRAVLNGRLDAFRETPPCIALEIVEDDTVELHPCHRQRMAP